MPSALKGSKVLAAGRGDGAANDGRWTQWSTADAYGPRDVPGARSLFANWQECQTNKKALRLSRRAFEQDHSKRSVVRTRFRCGRLCGHFRLGAAQPPDRVGAHAPEDGELRGLRFLRLSVLALVFRADELSVNKDMVALVERCRD